MSSVHKRTPFKYSEEAETLEDVVLDEEEQEDVIEDLRLQNKNANAQAFIMLRAIISLAIFLHFMALSREINPLDAFFSNDHPSPMIPLAPLFTFTHVALLLDLALYGWTNFPWIFRLPPVTHKAAYVIAGVAPFLCVVTGQGWVNIAWWSFGFATVGVDDFIHRMVARSEAYIADLEKKKYLARGA
ncbi:hypothetical protein OF83DRAFT_1104363 [Amylostereum chailletii]|nr:hypothetical protein OF83DRAFT_1104363 [Amylostereum chailletii]